MAEPSILAIDPGSRVAAASLFIPERINNRWTTRYLLRGYRTILSPNSSKVREVLEWASDIAPFPLRQSLEDQFISPNLRGERRRKLVRSAFLWEILADDEDINTDWINVSAWQSKILAGLPKTMTTKERARAVVFTRFGLDLLDDEADALCIGLHSVQKLERKLGGHIHIKLSPVLSVPS